MDASTTMIKIFQTQRYLVPPSKVQNVNISLSSWWPGQQGQGQTYDKVLSLCIFGINIKIYFKWILVYGHLSLLMVIKFCFVAFTGVHSSDMGPLGPVVSKLYAYSVENP